MSLALSGISDMMKLTSYSVAQTIAIGRMIAENLKPGDIICLFGQLGSGKTVLTKGIAEGLGIKKEDILSPSFVLLREYEQGRLPLYHFDLYRLAAGDEILGLGYEEYFYGRGVAVIEWAEKLKRLLPEEYLRVELSLRGEKKRLLKLSAVGIRYQKLLRSIA